MLIVYRLLYRPGRRNPPGRQGDPPRRGLLLHHGGHLGLPRHLREQPLFVRPSFAHARPGTWLPPRCPLNCAPPARARTPTFQRGIGGMGWGWVAGTADAVVGDGVLRVLVRYAPGLRQVLQHDAAVRRHNVCDAVTCTLLCPSRHAHLAPLRPGPAPAAAVGGRPPKMTLGVRPWLPLLSPAYGMAARRHIHACLPLHTTPRRRMKGCALVQVGVAIMLVAVVDVLSSTE